MGVRVGSVLWDRYEIRSRLGAGGMGEVWLARDLKLQVEVALKSVRAEFLQSEKRRDLLRREVRAAREVVSPNVCRVFDLVSEEGLELVSMEFVDGHTLADLLKERAPLALGEARELAAQCLAGLEAVHDAGLVHRDLKPENVMITRTGRVVVMDLGLAKPATTSEGSVAGTPAYMAPEQARGGPVDARTDVFASGVVLAEMVAPAGVRDREKRLTLWEGIRQEPPRVPEGPWADVIAKAVSSSPSDRYGSARELARALDRVTVHAERGEDAEPYPGLSAFTAKDRERFFGREAEVEQLLRKLGRARLLALTGPSGAGKTSFLQAGLVPSLPEGWSHVVVHPGDRPFSALAEALVPELSGDTEAMRELVRTDDDEALLSALRRWRGRHDQVVLIADQLEELFTLNPPEVQARLAALLGRLPVEADIHVLLSLRDDFLLRCREHEALAPVFTELTGLVHPTGPALRRALVQPAVAEGFRFEDDALVDAMLAEVEHERGALPLLAFAAARLWEKRDREAGLLTRQAYEEIGGVGGALAQHAEAILEDVGASRAPIARELFRNLVTAESTRASRERAELLSVFDANQAEAAAEVLDALIDARLLTSYELPGQDGREGRARIEVVHESLLTAWPRLVHWSTQDAEGAQLRDQLRQAARLWEQRGRPADLLWTGTSYREYALWRERYGGGLSAAEDAFAVAMRSNATRRRRLRRVVGVAAVALAAAVAVATTALWQRSDVARREAEAEAARREAAQLMGLGRMELAGNPTAALAFATASLERADNEPARLLALEALWNGPLAFVIRDPIIPFITPRWSADGRWLALGGSMGTIVLEREGGRRHQLSSQWEGPRGFTAAGDRLVTSTNEEIRLWSVPEFERLETWAPPGLVGARLVDRTLFHFVADDAALAGTESELAFARSLDGGPVRAFGRWPTGGFYDGRRGRILSVEDGGLVDRPLEAPGGEPRVLFRVGTPSRPMVGLLGDRFVTGGSPNELHVWQPRSGRLCRTLRSPFEAFTVATDRAGRYVAAGPAGPLAPGSFQLFDLDAPRGTERHPLLYDGVPFLNGMTFHPDGTLLASSHAGTVLIWNLAPPRPLILNEENLGRVAFTPDGRLVSASFDGFVRLWPLWSEIEGAARVLRSPGERNIIGNELAVSADGRFVVTLEIGAGHVIVLPLDGSAGAVLPQFLSAEEEIHGRIESATLAPDGQRVAYMYFTGDITRPGEIRILDLGSGETRTLRVQEDADLPPPRSSSPLWMPDGRLVSDGTQGLRVWDLATGTSRVLRPPGREAEGRVNGELWATPQSTAILSVFRRQTQSGMRTTLLQYDIANAETREVTDHGDQLGRLAFDSTGSILVSSSLDGVVRVGPLAGGEPHLLYGHGREVSSVAVSPDDRWIASASGDGTIRLWPMPDISQPPLHTLPLEQLLPKLRALTNLRVVEDPGSLEGYKTEARPFPGWEKVPTW